jgi:ribosome-associated protein
MAKSEVRQQVALVLAAAESKKADNISVLQLPKESSAFTDFFIVCSGSNQRQVQAIADEIDERLSKAGFEPNHREGYQLGEWILLDYVDFVVHIFNENARKYYDLERLWKSAKKLEPTEVVGGKKTARPAAKSPARKVTAKSSRRIALKKPTHKAAKKTVARRPTKKGRRK